MSTSNESSINASLWARVSAVGRESLTPNAQIINTPFVGSDLTVVPSSSAFGAVARIVRLNALEPVDVFRLLRIRTRRADDLSALMTFSHAAQAALASALRLQGVPPTWNLTAWFPFQASSELLKPGWTFRYCPQCLHSGYHTLLHQLPWFQRCPWHGTQLRRECLRCGKKQMVLADWAFDANLTCACGHAPLSTRAALRRASGPPSGAADFIAEYLVWAAAERARNVLIVPELPEDTESALAELVHLPRDWMLQRGVTEGRLHRRTWRARRSVQSADREAIRHLDVLRHDRPGFLTVPSAIRNAIAGVAANLALKLPPSTLTDREMTLFLAGAGIDAPKCFEPAKRAFSGTLSALPPWELAGKQFLNLACLHPVAYRAVVGLCDVAQVGRSLFDFHGQATDAELELLTRVCGHLLARGYAEGLRATLSRHIPVLYEFGRDAPHLTKPWILASRDHTRLVRVRAVWKPMAFSGSAEELLEAEDQANLRREGRPRKRNQRGKLRQ
ncbi:MAG: hypothetical protein JSR26_05210 [Proteobacteria bacterium]|nr:hypothetical protein [Pseudomonadota bacterium]